MSWVFSFLGGVHAPTPGSGTKGKAAQSLPVAISEGVDRMRALPPTFREFRDTSRGTKSVDIALRSYNDPYPLLEPEERTTGCWPEPGGERKRGNLPNGVTPQRATSVVAASPADHASKTGLRAPMGVRSSTGSRPSWMLSQCRWGEREFLPVVRPRSGLQGLPRIWPTSGIIQAAVTKSHSRQLDDSRLSREGLSKAAIY